MERNNETRKRYNNIISPKYLKTREVSYHIVVISFFGVKEEEILQVLKSEERAALKKCAQSLRVCVYTWVALFLQIYTEDARGYFFFSLYNCIC